MFWSAEQFCDRIMQEQVKIQKSTNNPMSSFGLIKENIELSNIYLAVLMKELYWKNMKTVETIHENEETWKWDVFFRNYLNPLCHQQNVTSDKWGWAYPRDKYHDNTQKNWKIQVQNFNGN